MPSVWERIRNRFIPQDESLAAENLRHNDAIRQAEHILDYSSKSLDEREALDLQLDTWRQHLKDNGMDTVKAWVVAAEILRDREVSRTMGRTETAAEVGTDLAKLPDEIRTEWTKQAIAYAEHPEIDISPRFHGMAETYNRIVGVLQDMDDAGKISLPVLPEIVHPEGMESAVDNAVYQHLVERDSAAALSKNRQQDPELQFEDRRDLIIEHLSDIAKECSKGSGCWYELYAQQFTSAVDAWIAQEPNPQTKAMIVEEANNHGDYCPNPGGRWIPDIENNDLVWKADGNTKDTHSFLHETEGYEAGLEF